MEPSLEQFPTAIADAVRLAMETTLDSICGEKPISHNGAASEGSCGGLVGVISFLGDISWTFTLALPQATALELSKKFAGFDIPYDSSDMGDVVGELANVIAGDIVARLEARRIKAVMSIPMVARGSDVEMITPSHMPEVRVHYRCPQGNFWVKLAAVKPGHSSCRKSGA